MHAREDPFGVVEVLGALDLFLLPGRDYAKGPCRLRISDVGSGFLLLALTSQISA